MANKAKLVDLKPYMPGINDILRSRKLDSLLEEVASKKTARCNKRAQIEGAEYAYEIVSRKYVRAAMVFTANYEAGVDNKRNNTLKKGCGV